MAAGTDLPSSQAAESGRIDVRIRALVPSLSPSARRVADVILGDLTAAATLTIGELARAAATSQTTVLRFCRELGFPGYPQLRLGLAAEAGRRSGNGRPMLDGNIGPDDDLDSVVRKIAYADSSAVEDTAAHLDLAVLKEVVDAVAKAGRVDMYGVGASAYVGADFQQKLHRIGKVAFVWSDVHMMLTSAALLGPGDVAFGISHTGSTQESIDALVEANRRGATTVAITNVPRSSIASTADLVLMTAGRETTYRSGATSSRIAQLTVVDCVFVAVAQRQFSATQESLQRTREAVAARRG